MRRFFLAALALLPATLALAQGGAPPPPAGSSASSLQAIRDQIDDLTLLKPLLPLKLTGEQLDALLPLLREVSEALKQLRKQDEDALKALGPDLAKAHAAALAGKPIPEALERKVADSNKESVSRYAAARRKAGADLLALLKEKLTAAQKAEIEKQSIAFFGGKRVPKQYADKPDKAPKEVVQDLAILGFIEQVLLFERSLPLVEKMRAAEKSASGG